MTHFANLVTTRYGKGPPIRYTKEQIEVASAMVESAVSIWGAPGGERFYYNICDKALRAVADGPADRWVKFTKLVDEAWPTPAF